MSIGETFKAAAGVFFALSATGCGLPEALAQDSAAEEWTRVLTAQPRSPAAGDTAAERQVWQRPDGREVVVAVRQPHPPAGAPRITIGAGPGDRRADIERAIGQLRDAGGGTLSFEPGLYRIGSTAGDGQGAPLVLANLSDVTLDGNGATLEFEAWGDGLRIANVRRLAVRGVTVRHRRLPILLGRIERSGDVTRLIMPGTPGSESADNLIIHQATVYDPASSTYPADGQRLLFGTGGLALRRHPAGGYVASGTLASLPDDTSVMVKLTYYLGAGIRISDRLSQPLSEDVTIEDVTVATSSGTGIAASNMGRGLAILDSHIGPAPGEPPSIGYDGIHVTSAAGDILIRNTTITGTGDDAINLAGRIERVAAVRPSRRLAMEQADGRLRAGHRIAMFDAGMRFLGHGAVVAVAVDQDGTRVVQLDRAPASDAVALVRNMELLVDRYAVIGNRISSCECHGVLAQGPNGLIADNAFLDLRYNAMRLLSSAAWLEGAGAHQVIVRGNSIARTGGEWKRGLLWGAISIYGEAGAGAGGHMLTAKSIVNADILVEGNRIAGVEDGCIAVANSARVTLRANECSDYWRRWTATETLKDWARIGRPIERARALAAYASGETEGIWIDPLTTVDVRQDPR